MSRVIQKGTLSTVFFNSFRCLRMSSESEERAPEDIFREYLQPVVDVQPPPRVTLEDFIKYSDDFVCKFPVQTARLKTLLEEGHEKSKLEDYINSAYPLIHEKVLPLLASFLHYKKIYGRKKERELYSSMGLLGLVDRLIKKRPIVFFKPNDSYLLRDGTDGCDGFEKIGRSVEKGALTITDYMSYDEIKLSALMSVSSQSAFINDGSRRNRGLPGSPGSYEKEGIIVGMVGARFEREGFMEWQDCVITPEQNIRDKGYGNDPPQKQWLVREWARLWGKESLPTWDQARTEKPEFFSLSSKMLFNSDVYKARIKLAAETLLTEAGNRAASVGLKAYVHVVGLGLGVWQVSSQQIQLFVDAWGEAIPSVDTTNIGHIDFSWISATSCNGAGDGEIFPGTNVTLHFTQRALHAPVPTGMLLVDSFAWDGNSMPGNEYWKGMLSASGDPAAACSSCVAELHNSLINPQVTADNLHVVSKKGIEHIAQYARSKL